MSTDLENLRELLARVESANGPSAELDIAIFVALFVGTKIPALFHVGGSHLANITSSIDAAVALCEWILPGWFWSVSELGATVELQGGSGYSSWGNTPSICLCAAILRAKIAQLENA